MWSRPGGQGPALAAPASAAVADAPPQALAGRMLRARSLLQEGDSPSIREAIQLLDHVLADQPELAPAHALQAEAWNAKAVAMNYDPGTVALARKSALRAIELAPDLAAGHFALGLTYRAAGRPEEALEAFRRAAELGEGPRSWRQLARVFRNQGAPDLALAWQERNAGSREEKPSVEDRVWEASLLLDLGSPDLARHRLQALEANHPTDPSLQYWLTEAFLALNQPQEGRAQAARWIRRDPESIHALALAGKAALLDGDEMATARFFEDSLLRSGDSFNPVALLGLALVHRQRGEDAAARTLLEPWRARLLSEEQQPGSSHWSGPFFLAATSPLVGRRQETLPWLRRALARGLVRSHLVYANPAFDEWRSDPEFQALMEDLEIRLRMMRSRVGTLLAHDDRSRDSGPITLDG
jgi:tetratricopeptide (TPR) repeat protein